MAVTLAPLDILTAAIDRQARIGGGRYCVAARKLVNGQQVMIRPDDVHPAASVIKVPVLAALYASRDEGRLSLDDTVPLRAEDKVGGSGVLQEMHTGLEVTLRDLAHLMIVVSDNTATNMVIDSVGLEYIEAFLSGHGFQHTRLQRRLFDLEARARGRDNWISAGEMVRLYEMLYTARLEPLNEASCGECLEILRRQQHTDKLPALLPRTARVASKPGSLDDVTHDTALVEPADGGAYAVAILCADFPSRRPAELAISKMSRLIYDCFTQGL